jgi:hypothetical protein
LEIELIIERRIGLGSKCDNAELSAVKIQQVYLMWQCLGSYMNISYNLYILVYIRFVSATKILVESRSASFPCISISCSRNGVSRLHFISFTLFRHDDKCFSQVDEEDRADDEDKHDEACVGWRG